MDVINGAVRQPRDISARSAQTRPWPLFTADRPVAVAYTAVIKQIILYKSEDWIVKKQ